MTDRRAVAIIGSKGTNAVPWKEAFLHAGFRVRNLVRVGADLPPRPNVDLVPFDLNDRATYVAALSGADVFALVTPPDPAQSEREIALIDAAKQAGVERIVNVSVIGADLPAPISAFARWQARVEYALERAGIAYVTLRPNSYMQNVLMQKSAIESGRYVEPSNGKPSSTIDVRDIADVAVQVSQGQYDGRAFDLTGPEALTGYDIAHILSEVRGTPVTYISPPISALRASLREQGAPDWRIDALAELYEAVQAGRASHTSRTTPNVESITGHPPRTFRQFAQDAFVR